MSLALHIACVFALFWTLVQLGAQRLPALVAAAFFALHPAAVYAAGYLVQRTILFATLFSLLSLALFLDGLRRERYPRAVAAAAAYWMAVLSKEHSILLPAAVLCAAPLISTNWRFSLRFGGFYAACCAPAALIVYLMRASLVGEAYEPGLGTLGLQMETSAAGYPGGSAWLASAMLQAALFFRYIAVWLWPAPGAMAIDMPVDLAAGWSSWHGAASLSAFGLTGAAALLLVLRARGALALAGYGLLFAWTGFLVEFAAVRFQEPFVIYRSYLWGPGLAIAVAAMLGRMPKMVAAGFGIAAAALLFSGATDRLETFRSPLKLWEDAAAKLPAQPVPGAARTLFNLAREQHYAGNPDGALATSNACVAKYPDAFYCYFSRGSLRLQQGDYAAALPDLDRALALQRDSGMARHHRGLALEGLGRLAEARTEYQLSRKLGFRMASYRLRLLDEGRSSVIRSAEPPRD